MKLDPTRRKILEMIARRDPPTDLKKASLACGKNHAYLHQFINRGTPRRLPEDVRHALADHLDIHEAELRDGQIGTSTSNSPRTGRLGAQSLMAREAASEFTTPDMVAIPEVRVTVAAGGGAAVNFEDQLDSWYFPVNWLRHELRARPIDLRIITIDGDSMEPMLRSGDRVLIDTSRRLPSPPGIFVLHDGIGLVIKQVEHIPNSDPPRISLKSINDHYENYERVSEEINIAGRVIWMARRL
jgi:phage repressor protein C with HTH and peptisase S24 domain